MHTTAYWLEIGPDLLGALPYTADDRRDGIHGLAFAMKQVATLLLMCDGHDIGLSINAGDATGLAPERPGPATIGPVVAAAEGDRPRVFIYDAYPGGIGFSRPLFSMHADLLARTTELIAGCGCDNGCPACVGPAGESGPRAKAVALAILDRLQPGHRAALEPARSTRSADEMPF
jgi:DEAD/DEAH box helicase domain-containing protein